MSDSFVVKGLAGERKLAGKIRVSGAKNSVMKVMASSLLFSDEIKISNAPYIEDVRSVGKILEDIGVKVDFSGDGKISLCASEEIKGDMPKGHVSKARGAVVITGPLLSRVGKISFPNPGGCNLGARPIDLFLTGYEKMGASVVENDGVYTVEAKDGKLKGTEIFFRVQSHTATETFIMAGVLAEGKTILKNCALEPEIKNLADFLVSCGAKIKGAGTNTIEIEGGGLLRAEDKILTAMPDRIEAGSFMILGALLGKEIVVEDCIPEHVEIVTEILKASGADISISENSITVRGGDNLKAVNIRTHEYPGLATDLQAPLVAFLTQTEGESAVLETIYEGRLNYTKDLNNMGANIHLEDNHRAIVKGKTPLEGIEMTAPDIRAGLAFIIAGAVAKGESLIHNASMIDRGYERLEEKLRGIGLDIKRVA